MAQVRVPPGGSNTPFGGVGLRRSPPTQAGQSGKSRVIAAGEAAPDTVDDLTATSVQSTSEVSKPVIGQTHVLNANDVASASQVSIPVLRQVHVILANDVQSASSVSVPALGVIRNLLANDVESASAVSQPVLGQTHALSADDVQSASEVTSPAVGQIHALAANDVESASQLSVPALTSAGGAVDALTANDVEAATELTRPALAVVGGTDFVPVPAMYGGGAASYQVKREDWERVKALLFPEERPRKKEKRQAHVRKLAQAVKVILPEIAPYEPIPQMAVLRQAVEALYRLPETKRQKIATPKAFAKAVFAQVKRIEDDEEDLILALIAA